MWKSAMAEMSPFLNGHSFDPETTRIMGAAFDKVTRGLHDRGQPAVVQELIAKRILDLAATGTRDPEQLAEQGISAEVHQARRRGVNRPNGCGVAGPRERPSADPQQRQGSPHAESAEGETPDLLQSSQSADPYHRHIPRPGADCGVACGTG